MGGPIPQATWEYLEERWFIDEALGSDDEGLSPHDIANEARKVIAAGGGSSDRSEPMLGRRSRLTTGGTATEEKRKVLLAQRRKAVSILLAREAAAEPDVLAFRADVLGGQMLSPTGAEKWILAQKMATPAPTKWVTVPVPDDASLGFDESTHGLYTDPPVLISERPIGDASIEFRTLDYVAPSSSFVLRVPTAKGTPLDRLRLISERLSKIYAWQKGQATTFVLTDSVPLVSMVRSSVRKSPPVPVAARITLEIDPVLRPAEVADHYRRIRDKTFGSRFRPLQEKATHLALFLAEQPEDLPWKTRLSVWNSEWCQDRPEWRYTESGIKSFTRDCHSARRKLLMEASPRNRSANDSR